MVIAKLKDSTVEIRNVGDLLRVARAVDRQEEPLVIQGDTGPEIVVPASPRAKRRKLTPEERARADDDAFLAAAGSWKDHIDPDEFMEQVRAGRRSRRPVYDVSLPDQ